MQAQPPSTHLQERNTLSRCICAHPELFTGLLHILKELLLLTHPEQKGGVYGEYNRYEQYIGA